MLSYARAHRMKYVSTECVDAYTTSQCLGGVWARGAAHSDRPIEMTGAIY